MTKIKKNLSLDGDKVISYTTHVATIYPGDKTLRVHGTWSQTTSRHIDLIAQKQELTKIFQAL